MGKRRKRCKICRELGCTSCYLCDVCGAPNCAEEHPVIVCSEARAKDLQAWVDWLVKALDEEASRRDAVGPA